MSPACAVYTDRDRCDVGTYDAFIEAKTQLDGMSGFEPSFVPEFLFPFAAGAVR